MRLFQNRKDAGVKLALMLVKYKKDPEVVVLALPRGGTPVAYEIAKALDAPLDVFVVRKLGVPGHEELAMGAIAAGGVMVRNQEVIDALNLSEDAIARIAAKEGDELRRREEFYRRKRLPLAVRGKKVILVDDGLATGSTMRAAVSAVRSLLPDKIIVAVPVAPPQTCAALMEMADEVYCLHKAEPFVGVGLWYQDFTQTTNAEVRSLLGAQ